MDEGLDGADRLRERVPVGDHVAGILGRTKRRHRPPAIELVASPQRVEDPLRIRTVGRQAPLPDPPAGPLLDRGVEEDLEVGIGQDDGADVATGDDDPAAFGEGPLDRQECGPDVGHAGHFRDMAVDERGMDVVGHVDVVDDDPVESSRGIGREPDLRDEPDEGLVSATAMPRSRASQVSAR